MVAIVAGTGTLVTAIGGGAYRVEKTSGVNAHDASAWSQRGVRGDFVLRVRDVGAPNDAIVGVSESPRASDGFQDIARSLQFYQASIYLYESGVYRPPVLSYADTVWFVRSAGHIRYHVGTEATPETLVRTVADAGAALSFDCSIAQPGGAIEVLFTAVGPRAVPRTRLSLAL